MLFRIAALAVAVLVLAFVVMRGGAPQQPAALAPGMSGTAPQPAAPAASASGTAPEDAAAPEAGASGEPSYGIIGPATKADPHTVKRAVQSLSGAAFGEEPPAASAAAPARSNAAPGKP